MQGHGITANDCIWDIVRLKEFNDFFDEQDSALKLKGGFYAEDVKCDYKGLVTLGPAPRSKSFTARKFARFMTVTEIRLETRINASPAVCFNASRDVGLHLGSAADTGERVLAGRTSGLCELGDEITWQARHFGIRQQLSVKITAVDFPRFFVDEMTRGAFKAMRHEHYFEPVEGGCLMKDKFRYETPFSIFGRLFDELVLKRHMTVFLLKRNAFLKQWCENREAR